MIVPVTAKAALLQVLTLGPGFGLELIERVLARTEGVVRLGQGSVYPALRALERAGLVEGEPRVVEGGAGRPRQYFRLTERGTHAAAATRVTMLRLFGDAR